MTLPRHCMVVHAYYPLAETRVQREAEALVRAGYAVDVICLREPGEPARERYRNVEIHRVHVGLHKENMARQFFNYLHFMARAGTRLSTLHLRRRYRTVQVHNLPDFLVGCAIVPKLTGTPVVLDLHDLMPEFFAGRFGDDGQSWLARSIRLQERLACRFASHVVTVSDHWREALIRRGVPHDKCTVVTNLADEHIFVRPAALAPDPERFELIYHGSVTTRYGLDLAIRAVAQVRADIPEIHLTILGKGDAMPDLVALRRELGVERHVDLRDELLTAEQLPAVIARADLGVVPYRNDVFTDGLLPTKLMEYAVMGVPCIASRTTAIERYFHDTMVEFFEPDDAMDLARCIRELYADPSRRAVLAKGADRFTDRNSWTQVSERYVALVGRLARSATQRSRRTRRTDPDSRRPSTKAARLPLRTTRPAATPDRARPFARR